MYLEVSQLKAKQKPSTLRVFPLQTLFTNETKQWLVEETFQICTRALLTITEREKTPQ